MLNTKTGKIVLGGFVASMVMYMFGEISLAVFVYSTIFFLIEIAKRDTNRKIEDASRNPKVTVEQQPDVLRFK